jgi:ATP-dependent exoDNAse (exonuclease V) beta subunit
VDEYQDTSTIQMDILLQLNAKYYYLIGDVNQSVFGYGSANCKGVEQMLQARRTIEDMTLSVNFRSSTAIVENSNMYSDLMAIPHHTHEGKVKKGLININDLEDLIKMDSEVVTLVRTNEAIRALEKEMMKRKVPIRYFNYIRPEEIDKFKKGKADKRTKEKFEKMKLYFKDNEDSIIKFIEENKNQTSFITTIHKAKGREFNKCVVVNSLSEDIVNYNGLEDKINKKLIEHMSFDVNCEDDFEDKNVHYVAISRPKNELYFMLYLIGRKRNKKE